MFGKSPISFALALAVGAVASHAATVSVTTSAGPAATTAWTVSDPEFGDYTVTVSGFSVYSNSGNDVSPNYHYRNSSQNGENDDEIFLTISGLNPNAYISSILLDMTRITPSVGSGSSWNYGIALSGLDVLTTLPVSDSRTLQSPTSTLAPDLSVAGNFGNAPVFTLSIDELESFSSRTIGTQNFTITASPIPEPATVGLLVLGGLLGLRRRR